MLSRGRVEIIGNPVRVPNLMFRPAKTVSFPRLQTTLACESTTKHLNVYSLLTTTNKMIVRPQRLSRVYRLLPRIARRTLTEETPKVVPNEDILPVAGVRATDSQETQHVAEMNEKLGLRKKAIASLKEAIQKPFSELQDRSSEAQSPPTGTHDPAKVVQRPLSGVYWALADGYEEGRHLEHGKGPLDRHDERGLPTWGDWGVCVKLTGWGGSTTLTLSVFSFCMNFTNADATQT